jgi:hypothetical protein
MATRARLTALSVVAVLGVACGRPVTTTARPLRTRAKAVETAGPPPPAPLVLESAAPARPPGVALVVHSGIRDDVVPGRLYTADWTTRGSASLEQASDPVPWPKSTTIAGGDDPTIAFDTSFMPDFVVVKVFTQVEQRRLTPIGIPIATFGCNRFTAPRCKVERTKSGLRLLDLDPTVYSGTYLVVFGQWHLPATQRSAGSLSDAVAASWLLRVNHTRAAAPSP